LFAVDLSRKLVPPKIRTFIEHLVEYISEIPLPTLPEKSGLETVPRSAASTEATRNASNGAVRLSDETPRRRR
jgi:hypothetical protein